MLVLERLELAAVPVLAPPLHARAAAAAAVRQGSADLIFASTAAGGARCPSARPPARPSVHVPQLAVLLRQPLGRHMQMLRVALELVRVAPRDILAAAALTRLVRRGGVGRELLELVRVVEQQRLLRADDLLLDRVVEVGHLLEDDAVAVELVRVSAFILSARDAEAERRELAYLAEEEHEPVRVVDAQRQVL